MTTGFPDQFLPVCRYSVRGEKAENIVWLNDALLRQTGAVYARVFEGIPVYVGSAQGSLRRRLSVHVGGTRRAALGSCYWKWAEGKQITIVAYKPDPVELFGRTIEIYRGVEAALINEFKPNPKGSGPWFVARI